MAGDPPVSLDELKTYPVMTSWFRPDLLIRLLWRVVVSDVFGQYADRRLIVAALDPTSPDELVKRAQQFVPETHFDNPDQRPPTLFTRDEEGALWIDFVADLGDGFDATFAIASLLSQESLQVGNLPLPRGKLLIMGGDEVYPNADQTFYHQRLINPYAWAFPDPKKGLLEGPPVYAIPGNHDWYDGLVLFLAYFTRRFQHLHLGGWRTWQRRSYFALRLTDKWWLWATDSQLSDDVDQPQMDYFDLIAKQMPENSRIILCGPEPGWLYTNNTGSNSLSVLDDIARSAINAERGLEIPLVLSGDTHHYSRYSGNDGVTQFITSGGGGAFLHPTHQLTDQIDLDPGNPKKSWLGGRVTTLKLKTDPAAPHADTEQAACYPTRSESLKLLKGNFYFTRLNPGFCFFVLGVIYWLAGLTYLHLWPDSLLLTPIVFTLGFWAYTKNQEGDSRITKFLSIANGIVHSTAACLLSLSLYHANNALLPSWLLATAYWSIPPVAFFAAEMMLIGGAIGGYLFGVYLYLSSSRFNMNHNDAFSSMRLDIYRNFLRIKIKDDEVTVYPIGLTDIPKRSDWRVNSEKKGCPPPAYIPVEPLSPHLIEEPITIVSADKVIAAEARNSSAT